MTCVGIQGAGNCSVDAAEGINYALMVYDDDGHRIFISNHGTDAGGGGTRKDPLDKLAALGGVRNYREYIYTTCALHGLNLCMSSPTALIMGDGGLLKRNALQCLHSAYNLSQQYDARE